jgi:signal transduction histidine kinase
MSGMGAALAPLPLDGVAGRASRRGTAALATAIAAAGGVACAMSMAAPALRGLPLHPLDQTIHAGVAAAYIGTGVVALLRRPGNATGLLMATIGFLWLVGDLYWIPGALAFTIAATFELFYQVVLAHLALAFPTGRLARGFERRVMVGLYAWTLVNNLVRMLFFDPRAEGCAGCPANLLLVVHDAGAERWRNDISSYLDTAVIVAVGAVIVRHWWRKTRAARHVIAPVLWAAVPAVVYLVTSEVADDFLTLSPTGARIVYEFMPAGLAVWPVGFLVSLLRTRFDYARVGALLPELAGPVAPGRVRDALAATLHDPQLELLYWSPVTDCYVGTDGQPREPIASPGRTMATISGESGPLAVMLVDQIVLQEPELLEAAGAMARLALENERLQADVRSQLVQLRSTTARLVGAGQDARRRIERDLHDGAQQRLLALSMTLGQARAHVGNDADPQLRASLEHAADDLQQAITELRELARGIHPMLLTQEGLASALKALAERAPLPMTVSAPADRFPDNVEATAYFVVTEAVTNVARHAGASVVHVEVSACGESELTVRVSDDGIGGADTACTGGSGLLGMRDRVVALGGRMNVSSPTGGGTTVVVRLPCA